MGWSPSGANCIENMTPVQKAARTVIWKKIHASGRMIKWYGNAIGYGKGNAFYMIARGQRIPRDPKRRLQLARLLDCQVSDLWGMNNKTGELEALR